MTMAHECKGDACPCRLAQPGVSEEFEQRLGMELAQQAIRSTCDAIKGLLLAKNKRYGNSALSPDTGFSSAAPLDQIAVRCGDKYKRIKNMGGLARVLREPSPDGEDTVADLIGYLVLACIAAHEEKVNERRAGQEQARMEDVPQSHQGEAAYAVRKI